MGFSNAYIVELDDQKLALIDTGTPHKEAKVLKHLADMSRKPSDISYIILTHSDGDHSGSAAALKRLTGAGLAISELDSPRLSGEKKIIETTGGNGLLLDLVGMFMRVERVRPDLELKDGSTLGPLTIVATPGHTDGSISVYKTDEAIFVGDLLRTDGSGNLKLASAGMSRYMTEVRRSVERISRLEFQMLLPGLGKPIENDASNKLRAFISSGFGQQKSRPT